MKRVICMLMLSAFFAGSLAACNTVKGAGKDVQKVGNKMENAADNTGGTGTH